MKEFGRKEVEGWGEEKPTTLIIEIKIGREKKLKKEDKTFVEQLFFLFEKNLNSDSISERVFVVCSKKVKI